MKIALLNIFLQKPGKWWKRSQLKKELTEAGIKFKDHEFDKEFLSLRDEVNIGGKRIVKFKAISNWQYVLTSDPKLIAGHNNQLSREIKARKKRIIQTL